MSRSNPTENGTPNPAVRWFEWNGELGTVRYYDKDAKQNIDCGADFTFLLLDELGSVRGWDDASGSSIYSNEVKDTRQDAFIVRSFKGGTLAEGLYKDIKDKAHTLGAQFVSNCYIAFKNGETLAIGSLRFKGAALGAWMDFRKANRAALFEKAVRINGCTEGKKGRIVFRVPVFELKSVSVDTNEVAVDLDAVFQLYLKAYLKKNTRDRAEAPHLRDEDVDNGQQFDDGATHTSPLTDEDIPF